MLSSTSPKSRFWAPVVVSALMVQAIGIANVKAQTINYGTFMGSTVIYDNVRETSATDPLPLYGAPSVALNTLDFDPTFAATANSGAFKFIDGQLNFEILSKTGNYLDMLTFSETGDYTLFGVGTLGTYVDVSAFYHVEIEEVDGVGITPVKLDLQMSFAPNANGTFDLVNDFGDGLWSGSLAVDITAALANAGVSYIDGATKVSIVLDNKLRAQSESGTSAFIAKKDTDALTITVETTPVPEPSTIALSLVGIAGLAMRLRKRGNTNRS